MTRSLLRPAFFALVAAVGLGLAGRVAIHAGGALPHGASLSAAGRSFVALGAPWLAVAWAVGAMAERRWYGALVGALSLATATVAWYSLSVAAGGRATVYYAWPVAPAWALVALVAGGVFGLARAAGRLRGGGPPAGPPGRRGGCAAWRCGRARWAARRCCSRASGRGARLRPCWRSSSASRWPWWAG